MKQLTAFFFLIILGSACIAQSQTNKIAYQKIDREAIVNNIPFAEDVTAKAIRDTLEKLGYKGKESKGFTVYKGVKLPVLGPDAYDLYFSVDKKSKKEKDISVVTMMISKGFDEFITEATEPALMSRAKTYLDNLRYSIAVYDHSQQVIEQEDVVKKIEKKSTNLSDDAENLQKKRKKIENEIEDNIKEQADQKKELEKQRQILETLRAKG